MDKLHAMTVFTRVAELSSFTQAANSLGLPKGSISMAVQNLEGHLGTRLLQRTTRKVVLTHDGQVFYQRCKDLLTDMDELESMFQLDEKGIQGRIRIDVPLAVAREVVMPHLPDFLAQHPGIKIELSSTDRRVDVVAEGFDCVLRVGNLGDSGLVARSMGVHHTINCASPIYVEKYGAPSTLDDLKHHFMVHYAQVLGSEDAYWEYRLGAEIKRIKMPSIITVNNSDAYTQACLAGLGIIQVPQAAAKKHLSQGKMLELLPEYQAAPMPITMLYPNRQHQPRRVKVFMDWLAERLQDYLA
ncbi:LysR family transcriptional regulator [Methylobacillus methanolivorans]|uniref:LysR family transcriptional regulator n=1 Tax=Methylobacillus methanolivorans TaxID=1848927 RepID=A0ABW8GMX7_9PROT